MQMIIDKVYFYIITYYAELQTTDSFANIDIKTICY